MAYKADIAGGSLKVYESRIIADLLLRRLPAADWRQAIEVDNVLQKTSIGTAIYLERGYTKREAARAILTKNLFGLDIDDRAAQMTCTFDRRRKMRRRR